MSCVGSTVSDQGDQPQKRKAIWFTPEVAAELEALQDQLAKSLGFKPTPSQIISHILRGKHRPSDGASHNSEDISSVD